MGAGRLSVFVIDAWIWTILYFDSILDTYNNSKAV